jgi:predicted NUDIX family NTP pyrophosphohydrolase
MEWPPKSGKMTSFPEIDKGGWFPVGEARQKINASQITFIDEFLFKIGEL